MNALDYFSLMHKIIRLIPLEQVGKFIGVLREAKAQGRTVFVAGNGGSAATASHFATDLQKAAGIRAVSLVDNVAMLTAYANDCGFENVFVKRLQAQARMDDVLVVITVSGKSKNVINAVLACPPLAVKSVALTGFYGGDLRSIVGLEVNVPNTYYGPTEDMHSMICHMVVEDLKEQDAA